MHQSIPAAPSAPSRLLQGICPPWQSRGWGICKFCAARGLGICQPWDHSQAFDKKSLVNKHCHKKTALFLMFRMLDIAFSNFSGILQITGDKESSPKISQKKRKGTSSQAASSRASTHLDKKTQQMVAELYRLKWQMTAFKQSIQRPPV